MESFSINKYICINYIMKNNVIFYNNYCLLISIYSHINIGLDYYSYFCFRGFLRKKEGEY